MRTRGVALQSIAAATKSIACDKRRPSGGPTKGDIAIGGAAEIAGARRHHVQQHHRPLAVLQAAASGDQGYLKSARQEEMSHYALEKSVTCKPSPFTTFYYAAKMFSDAQTMLNVLVTLEDAFGGIHHTGHARQPPELSELTRKAMDGLRTAVTERG